MWQQIKANKNQSIDCGYKYLINMYCRVQNIPSISKLSWTERFSFATFRAYKLDLIRYCTS